MHGLMIAASPRLLKYHTARGCYARHQCNAYTDKYYYACFFYHASIIL